MHIILTEKVFERSSIMSADRSLKSSLSEKVDTTTPLRLIYNISPLTLFNSSIFRKISPNRFELPGKTHDFQFLLGDILRVIQSTDGRCRASSFL
jgi:hypothetical protein